MAAMLAASLPVGSEWSYEVKWDGYRALLLKDGRRPRIISRNLKDLTADYLHIAAAAATVTPHAALLDGEIVALDVGYRLSRARGVVTPVEEREPGPAGAAD